MLSEKLRFSPNYEEITDALVQKNTVYNSEMPNNTTSILIEITCLTLKMYKMFLHTLLDHVLQMKSTQSKIFSLCS